VRPPFACGWPARLCMRLLHADGGYAQAAPIASACEQCVTRDGEVLYRSAIGLPLW
jgi:hypothetical protein